MSAAGRSGTSPNGEIQVAAGGVVVYAALRPPIAPPRGRSWR